MDPTETESPSHSPSRRPPELGFHAQADPDPEPDRAAREDEAEILREEIKERLHLEEEEVEEEKGYDGNFSCDNYNGWGDEGGGGGEGVVNNNGGGWSDWGDDKVADEDKNSGKEAAAWGVEIEEVGAAWYDHGQRSNVGFGGGGGGNYPVRPGAEDCSFYIKTGTCKFGSSCKFNHPVRTRTQPAKERGNDGDDTTERPEQLECKSIVSSLLSIAPLAEKQEARYAMHSRRATGGGGRSCELAE